MRLSKSSLLRMLLMCALTVATLMNKAAANFGVGLAAGNSPHDLCLSVAERPKPIFGPFGADQSPRPRDP